MVALADALRSRGHQVVFFLLGHPPAAVSRAGFEVVSVGGTQFPAQAYQEAFEKLGTLTGRAGLKHTFAMGARSAEALLANGPGLVKQAGVKALIVDQATTPGGTIADQLGLPFATVCNALILHPEPGVPPFFTSWLPGKSWWSRLKNQLLWAGLQRLYRPILKTISVHRAARGLSPQRTIADAWSTRLQVSQQPEAFEFPRQDLPGSFHFVGPLRLPGGYAAVEFPWHQLDGRPLIYASLGTLQNRIAEVFRAIALACSPMNCQVVISTGKGIDPGSLGNLPGNPIVVDYAPQWEILKRADLAITHAGLNTVLDCLSLGVPMVAMPITNEQPGIAARVSWVGAGEVLPLANLTPEVLGAMATKVLKEPGYRAAAARVKDSVGKGGGAPRAAELVETALLS